MILNTQIQTAEDRTKIMKLQQSIIEIISELELIERVNVTMEFGNHKPSNHSETAASGPLAFNSEIPLSARQQEIMIKLMNNHSVRRIAKDLFISENTVKKHIQNIKKILGLQENGADFIYAIRKRYSHLILSD